MRERTPLIVSVLTLAVAITLGGALPASAQQFGTPTTDDTNYLSLTGFVGIAAITIGMIGLVVGLVRRRNAATQQSIAKQSIPQQPTPTVPHLHPAHAQQTVAVPRR